MSALFDKRLVFVTGKGGVGKTTVAAALGVAGARAGKRTIAPQGPTREQVQRMLVDQVYDVYEEKYLRDLRRTALIDYKDPSLRQDQTQ